MKGREAPSTPNDNSIDNHDETVSDYEKQRLSRIRENRARLEALGLPTLASSLLGPPPPKQQRRVNKSKSKKRSGDEDDEEYQPSDEEEEEEEDQEESSSGSGHEDVGPSSSSRKKGKEKSNAAKFKKPLKFKGKMIESDHIDDDAALQLALALSLGGGIENSARATDDVSQNLTVNAADASAPSGKVKANMQESSRKRKSSKMNRSRIQLTEDEVVAYFFSFDEAGKGHITLRDLQRMVIAHDYNWTGMEMANMIQSFDSDRDGQLSLEDFRTIVSRCKMMQDP